VQQIQVRVVVVVALVQTMETPVLQNKIIMEAQVALVL
jgi:hypothetical protein